eukprot:TRINITY_DN2280_c0_g1_i6.p4 TRINITY_DN2280_c0_g1~~TRINITY_DN2280_c0_g1_i6.p4  ORF type:complete len:184 (+),score=76.64 TRINITY_DN2280_c0_g1_i6:210-761(+)
MDKKTIGEMLDRAERLVGQGAWSEECVRLIGMVLTLMEGGPPQQGQQQKQQQKQQQGQQQKQQQKQQQGQQQQVQLQKMQGQKQQQGQKQTPAKQQQPQQQKAGKWKTVGGPIKPRTNPQKQPETSSWADKLRGPPPKTTLDAKHWNGAPIFYEVPEPLVKGIYFDCPEPAVLAARLASLELD